MRTTDTKMSTGARTSNPLDEARRREYEEWAKLEQTPRAVAWIGNVIAVIVVIGGFFLAMYAFGSVFPVMPMGPR